MSTTAETRIVSSVDDLPSLAGRAFGPSDWRTVTQEQVNTFADLTGDHNPIHIDAEAAAKTPFGTTIVHGYFTLSLVVPLMAEVFEVTDAGMGVNYGIDKLRFPAPVPVGSRIRLSGTVSDVKDVGGGYQLAVDVVFEVDGGTKPACAATLLLRYYR